jgi:hypothetical protein
VIQRGTLEHELRKPRALATYDSSALFDLKIPEVDARHVVQEFLIGGTKFGSA